MEMRRVFSTEKKALRRTGPEVTVCVPYLRNGLETSGARVELPRGSDRGNKDPGSRGGGISCVSWRVQ